MTCLLCSETWVNTTDVSPSAPVYQANTVYLDFCDSNLDHKRCEWFTVSIMELFATARGQQVLSLGVKGLTAVIVGVIAPSHNLSYFHNTWEGDATCTDNLTDPEVINGNGCGKPCNTTRYEENGLNLTGRYLGTPLLQIVSQISIW